MENSLAQIIFMGLVIGAASGAIGSFVILRRMSLVGDALSHVALPGIALALFYGFDPFWGVLVFLFSAVLLVWYLEGKSRLPTDALVGILFTTSLAVGVLAIPDEEIFHSLFGAFPALSWGFLTAISGVAVFMIVLSLRLARKFLFPMVSSEISKVYGVGRKYDLYLLLIFSVVVALGIKLVGTLLMGALVIIPASIAKNISRSMAGFISVSVLLGALISLGGIAVSQKFGLLPGPAIILLGAGLFVISLLGVKK